MKTEHDFYYDHLIIFSPDDEDKTGKGWYAQDTSIKGWPTTELFETREDLINFLKAEYKVSRYTS